jgi:hypothetical protein
MTVHNVLRTESMRQIGIRKNATKYPTEVSRIEVEFSAL